jgi:N-acetylglucosaminyldiphosphoundecaprenol N-acetyl-beta-D-mannosaminyltransferase
MNGRAPRLWIGHIPIDRLAFAEALESVKGLVETRRGGTVFTPNVDHIVMAEDDEAFRKAYARTDLSLADGMPVVWASRLLGSPLPAKISGSDLVPPLMDLADGSGWRVYLLGGGEGVAHRAAENLARTHEHLQIVGAASPRIDLSTPRSARQSVVEEVRRTSPDLVLVGLGAPKQEMWIDESIDQLRPAVLLGVGASIDFLAGTARRAPRWVSAWGLEWLYRLAREPFRLWRRYLVRDPRFVGIVLRERAARHSLDRTHQELGP